MKGGLIGYVLYRSLVMEDSYSGMASKGKGAFKFETSLLGRLTVVLFEVPNFMMEIPKILDADLAWLIAFLPPKVSVLITSARLGLIASVKDVMGYIPWQRIIFIIMDIVGCLLLFRLTRLVSRLSHLLPSLMTPSAWLRYLKQNGYALVKDLPMVKNQLKKELEKMEAQLDVDLKARSRGIVMVRDHEEDHNSPSPRKRHTPGADMLSPHAARKREEEDASVHYRSEDNLNRFLPKEGRHAGDLLSLMRRETKKENTIWQEGKVSGAVYHGEKEHQDLLNAAFSFYSLSNPLHPDIWPSTMKFESEIVSMTANLMNGGKSIENTEICGCTTSGGTESIVLAIKAARDYYREKKGIGRNGARNRGEVIACVSAHAAVDKACDMMGLKLVHIEYDHNPNSPNPYQIDVRKVRAAITSNTILIYSSAPSFPHGVIDPVVELGAIAKRNDVALHVDCCLGGFILPFARDTFRALQEEAKEKREAGDPVGADELLEEAKLYKVPEFDFSVPGVTSMSVDTHKFGYSLKGTSVVLYGSKAMRQAQYFCYAEWTGGMYTTPTIAGSRSGGLIAQCWTSMMSLGYSGYLKNAKAILRTTKELAEEVRRVPGVKLLGQYEAMIVCFASADPTINTYRLADAMTKKGWSLNTLQNPPCVHLCVTVCHLGKNELFLKDLKEAIEACRDAVRRGEKESGVAAIYGMASSMPAGPVEALLRTYNDVVLKV